MAERSADDIKRDIERSRAELASAVDQLAYRGNPKRIAENAKASVKARLNTPQGQAVLAVVGGVVVVLVIKRFRKDEPKGIEKAKQTAKHTAKQAAKQTKQAAKQTKQTAKQTKKKAKKRHR